MNIHGHWLSLKSLKSITSENSMLKEKMEQLNETIEDLKTKLPGTQEKTEGLPTDLLKKR